ncbi:MAG: hypothetical protein J1E01_01330 [Acetatifactor sp.]|nr:hypothetical protein [Acetatifactor sp.]
MERLTHKARYQAGYKANWDIYAWECIDKLGQLEDLEEQGLLVKLPFKIGDTIYADSGVFHILPYTVDSITIDTFGISFTASSYSQPIGDCPSECLDEIEENVSEIGKSVFLTREQALKEMEEIK